jgi:hypothetical protein
MSVWDTTADEKRLRVRSQVIDMLEAQDKKETGSEKGEHSSHQAEQEFLATQVDHRIKGRRLR